MDRSNIINLISCTYTADDLGQQIATETSRQVFCDVKSVSQAEWFEGGRNGLKPEYKITMFLYDYNGEKVAEFDGVRYSIYRTFKAQNEVIELYLEAKAGV